MVNYQRAMKMNKSGCAWKKALAWKTIIYKCGCGMVLLARCRGKQTVIHDCDSFNDNDNLEPDRTSHKCFDLVIGNNIPVIGCMFGKS